MSEIPTHGETTHEPVAVTADPSAVAVGQNNVSTLATDPHRISALRRPIAWLFDAMIAGYQRWFSPMLPPACRFQPSCSRYARAALRHHSTPRALGLTVWRVARCQPLCAGGVDPVPPGRFTPLHADMPSEVLR